MCSSFETALFFGDTDYIFQSNMSYSWVIRVLLQFIILSAATAYAQWDQEGQKKLDEVHDLVKRESIWLEWMVALSIFSALAAVFSIIIKCILCCCPEEMPNGTGYRKLQV